MSRKPAFTFLEFFAGGGMARVGLGEDWRCLFANDFDAGKAVIYRANFGGDDFREGDIHAFSTSDVPGRADLAWASSPCQDFSLAGARAGLGGGRSSAFYGFWRLIQGLKTEGRAPSLVVVENVVGLLTSHGGRDFEAVCAALAARGYRFGALEIDAALFVPQSRPRIFIVATKGAGAGLEGPSPFHTRAVRQAHGRLPAGLAAHWIWWGLAAPPARNTNLAALLEPDDAVAWRSEAQTEALLALMDERHRARVLEKAAGEHAVGAVFRRMRAGRQRAEARFDGLAGCLRTPKGGSSRQLLLVAGGGRIRSRWLTAREGARLMGLPETYRLPRSESAGLHVIGDGVAAPVVRHLADELLEPLLLAPTSAVAAE